MSSRALSSDVITDAQISAIRTHCVALQASLNRLHQTDALLRYNRGQLYTTIRDKLMTPLNQRIASNQLDGSKLVKTTASFDSAYDKFYEAYRVYENSLSRVLDTDCTRQPTTFYSRLADAREKRLELHAISQQIVALAVQYKVQFDAFAQGTREALADG